MKELDVETIVGSSAVPGDLDDITLTNLSDRETRASMKELDVETIVGSSARGTTPHSALSGVHDFSSAMDVVMLVPGPLQLRALFYPDIASLAHSFFYAPAKENISVSFTFLCMPKELQDYRPAEYDETIKIHLQIIRTTLHAFGGYEVHEADGNVLTAFSDPTSMVAWMLATQEQYLHARWPFGILDDPSCAPVVVDGEVLFRGPRVGMGATTGDALRMRPCLRTGKAEYFGPIMNHAARLAQAAHGGQVLVSKELWDACSWAERPAGSPWSR
eukprot:CAMPEP_0182852932 /NCGR_PEP_ID=MMETSP0034_2-20130328/431_1 /TAXON_ID=156128 /ORGANISM="Nephroselmis pyriformis, Strain CCMP717" /LENGTH=273 /DNA_ID=CAMNT_0024983677 /DNA_START=9 /DNA_END=827 /DNA_ORIENTATION=+